WTLAPVAAGAAAVLILGALHPTLPTDGPVPVSRAAAPRPTTPDERPAVPNPEKAEKLAEGAPAPAAPSGSTVPVPTTHTPTHPSTHTTPPTPEKLAKAAPSAPA